MNKHQITTERAPHVPIGELRELPFGCIAIRNWRKLDPTAVLYLRGRHWRRVLGPIYAPHELTFPEFDAITRGYGAVKTTQHLDGNLGPAFTAWTPAGSRLVFSPRKGIISGPWYRRGMSIASHMSYLEARDDGDVDEDAQMATMMAFLSGAYDQGAA